MDKETLSNYGWIVICTLVLAVMIALATPFGEYIKDGVWSTTNGLNDTLNKNMEIAGLSGSGDNDGDTPYDPDNVYTFTPTEMEMLDRSFVLKEYHSYTLNVEYDNGTSENVTAFAIPLMDNVVELYSEFNYQSAEDDYVCGFALYNNCSYDIDEEIVVYAEGESFYGLYEYYENDVRITSVTIDFNNSVDYSDNFGAFFIDGTFLTWDELKSEYDVTDTSINEYAFDYNYDILSIKVPDGVTSIGESAFYYCTSLIDINLPETLTFIGNGAFAYTSLVSVTIPNGVTTINISAFGSCYNLVSIAIPASITYVDAYAFYYSYSIYRVNITDLTAWCNIKFVNEQTSPLYNGFGNLYLNGELIEDLTIPDGVTELEHNFAGASIKSVTIPASVTSINFRNCENLETIVFEGTIEQWNNISKGYYCYDGVPATHVTCSDGTVAL